MKTKILSSLLLALFFLPAQLLAGSYPITFMDSAGKQITITTEPKRVVSLVPSITEMLLRIGVEDAVSGITYHSVMPAATDKKIIGGFFAPDSERIALLNPDLIFYSSLQTEVVKRFQDKAVLVNLSAKSIEESFSHIKLLGRIFQHQTDAEALVAEEERQLAVIAAKIQQIPEDKRQRVIRFMGQDKVMVPGDDSFQNDFILAAGGIAPELDRKGNVIELSLQEWQDFNPQVIYGCGKDKKLFSILEQPGWNEVEAIQNKQTMTFACELTCRASTRSGYFVSWLAARIYGDEFSDLSKNVLPERIVRRQDIAVELEYLNKAEVIESDIRDFRNKTVAISLTQPMSILSTLEGWRSNITTIANHYFPPPSWGLGHRQGVDALRQHTLEVLGFDSDTTSIIFTGADMDNLAVAKKSFRDLTVYAIVTAGVESNAVRMAKDSGSFYEPDTIAEAEKPGTINVLLLTNVKLSPRAMTRAMISATEAKSAALADLDIRSSYTSQTNPATGTGTDNVLVVEGSGLAIDNSGGHTKMGELIARAVYEGVHKAIRKQNGLTAGRSVFKRLKERGISIWELAENAAPEGKATAIRQQLGKTIMQPEYASFLEAAFTLSDDYERGLIKDLSSFDLWCQSMADAIAAKKVALNTKKTGTDTPLVLRKAFNALLRGVMAKFDTDYSGPTRSHSEAAKP